MNSTRAAASSVAAARRPQSARRRSRQGGYHHGDLKAALIQTSIDLIAERGVRGFSLTEASRRLGVAVSAPYAHFADRDELLAAIAVRALELFHAELKPRLARAQSPEERLSVLAHVYVRFAAAHRPLFQTLFDAGLDKRRHPEVEAAERPIEETFLESVRALSPTGDKTASESIAAAVEAIAHGHAMLLLDGRFGHGQRAVKRAADNAAVATLALIDGRDRLHPASTARKYGPSE